jgi:ATP-dependent DNA helicase RecQ
MLENFRSQRRIIGWANEFVRSITDRLKHSPIYTSRHGAGSTKLTLHRCENYEEAIIKDITSRNIEGSIGVLTLRNEDALILAALLNRQGRKARLIQSNNGFSLQNLAELRTFLNIIKESVSSVIPITVWDKAKTEIQSRYSSSTDLRTAMLCIRTFEEEYRTKYLSDLETFILESDIADFDTNTSSEIVVSTIHKAKGREFDNVFISLKGLQQINDAEKRAIYVGITRAKRTLSIHSNVDLSGYMSTSSTNYFVDTNLYNEPDEIVLQLSHRDVVLNYFKDKTELIESLRAGGSLTINDVYAETLADHKPARVVKFSEAFKQRMSQLTARGYHPHKVSIRHIVYWRYEDSSSDKTTFIEIPIILPDITFIK